MPNSVETILLGDIGATNARFALFSNGKLNAISSFEVAKFGQFTDVLERFLKEQSPQTKIRRALLATLIFAGGLELAASGVLFLFRLSQRRSSPA